MGHVIWLIFTTVVGAIIGHFIGSAWIGAIIGFVVGLVCSLGIVGDFDVTDIDFPDFSD